MSHQSQGLVVDNLRKTFFNADGDVYDVVAGIDLHVGSGELVALIGPSGCGKTTLLNCVAGLEKSDGGIVSVGNKRIEKGTHLAAYMMQEDGLLPWRSVVDNVVLPLQIKGIAARSARLQAESILDEFGLSQFLHSYPDQLSGGMRQRVTMARMYLTGRELLLMDEPFSRLDMLTKMRLQRWFMGIWHKHAKTVLFVTHDIEEAIFLADRIYVVSARPATVVAEYKVPFSRPRSVDMLTSVRFGKMKKKLMSTFSLT